MIRRSFTLIAGAAVLAAVLTGAGPALAQDRRLSSRPPAFRRFIP